MIEDFFTEDKASGENLHRGSSAYWAGNVPFLRTLLPQTPKIGRIGQRVKDDECSSWWLHGVMWLH